ncbi:MAG: WXG100 family type VII secretion target [Ruminococcus sp.]|nr:WXG100 family type VII secretion target [Ruminococcus sp.]
MASSAVGNNAYLKVKPADLDTKAQQIQTKIGVMTDLMGQMTTAFNTVSDNWQSTSGDEYKSKADTLISEIKESLENLAYYVSDLKEAASKFEQLESEIQGKVGALDDPSSIFNV